MKKLFKRIGILAGLAVLAVVIIVALMPWMDRWGAMDGEIAASFTGDELVPSPAFSYNRAVTINASPQEIYPWIVQLGAERGGMYSYTWFETNILQCELINADRIHEEWQALKVGDQVKMCPGNFGPTPYEVAIMEPNRAIILGHQENGQWSDVWQFVLLPQTDGTTRLVLRSRDMKTGGLWDVIRPGVFIMERGMLLGIKERAERLAETVSVPPVQEMTPIPASHLQTVRCSEYGQNFALSYDPTLASQVETATIPAVPVSDQILFAESHPAYVQIRFVGFQAGRAYELPLLPLENRDAQVMIFQTEDFAGYGDDNPQGFVDQLQALTELLETDMDSDRCVQPFTGPDQALPFLPWINAQQSFCAQPQIIEFSGGKGIRYLSHYAQGPGPALDHQIFYTFQGLTDDGQFYVSALFPVQTGIFPTEPVPCPKCGEADYDPFAEWTTLVTEQLIQLNGQPANSFSPSLTVLDKVIKSIQIGQE